MDWTLGYCSFPTAVDFLELGPTGCPEPDLADWLPIAAYFLQIADSHPIVDFPPIQVSYNLHFPTKISYNLYFADF